MVRFANLKPSKKILDEATGTGAQAYEFAKQGHEVVGIDCEPSMLLQAEKKLNPKLMLCFQKADGTNLPFRNNSFDITVFSWSTHEMPFEIGIRVMQEMKRVTKDEGRIIIVDWMEPKKHLVSRILSPLISLIETKYYQSFIKEGIEAYIKKVGLKVIKGGNFLGIWQLLILEKGSE